MADPSADHRGDERADEATLADLRRRGAAPPPRTEFAHALKEELMHAPAAPFSIAPGTDRRSSPISGQWRPLPNPRRHPMIGGLATAALLAITLIGAYLAVLAPNDPKPDPPTVAAAAPSLSPEASPEVKPYECTTTDTYFGCPRSIRNVGANQVWLPHFDAPALEADQVQLQGWAIAPGAVLPGADTDDGTAGAVIDFVLSGAYVATFDGPVVVHRGAITNDLNQVAYVEEGGTFELVRGDSVSYQLGDLVEVHNPLNVERIEFKRAVLYTGDISAFAQTADGVTNRIEAGAALRGTIGAIVGATQYNELRVVLVYLQIHRGAAFPPAQWEEATVIGPVDPQHGPEGTDGFVLVIGNTIPG
jgi:hypothetical protein